MTIANITDWWALPGTSGPGGVIAGFVVLFFILWVFSTFVDNDDDKGGSER